jgi:hypothetical protein
MKLAKLGDRCWEGLTLQHVSQKEIVLPYLIFISIALVFEIFMVVLSIVTSFLFISYGYKLELQYVVSVVILVIMLCLTLSILIKVRNKDISR